MKNQNNLSNILVSSDLKELEGSETVYASGTQREVKSEAKHFVIFNYPGQHFPRQVPERKERLKKERKKERYA